jgi:hypothetical protein
MVCSILVFSLVAVSGFNPPFFPPGAGIGSETAGGGVRAFSMGGASAGVPDSGMVSILNPAASAWAENTGLSWGTKVRNTPDQAWSGASAFPEVSVMMPLPLGVQLSAILSGRSRLNSSDDISFGNVTGSIDWTGSTGESYIGATVSASRTLAFSLGGRCFFGSAMGEAVTSVTLPGPYSPITTEYRDDLAFDPSWGLNFGAFYNSGIVAAGFSITTDRSGSLSIERDYMGNESADTTLGYSVPGELTCGVSARIHPRLLVAVDYFARKKLTLLEGSTPEGSFIAGGLEFHPGLGFSLRGGYRSMEGLWRDGASMYTGGVGYDISGGKASIDVGAGWETWGDDLSETVVYMGIRASENWLGR